jgi:hypothetical protein
MTVVIIVAVLQLLPALVLWRDRGPAAVPEPLPARSRDYTGRHRRRRFPVSPSLTAGQFQTDHRFDERTHPHVR